MEGDDANLDSWCVVEVVSLARHSSKTIRVRAINSVRVPPRLVIPQVGGVPLTSLLVADDQEKLPTGQCRPRVPPSPINLRGEAYLNLRKIMSHAQVSFITRG